MMKKLFLCLTFLLSVGNAYANISIFPYSVDFEAKARKRVQSVRVINTSDETHTYRVSVINYLQSQDGKLTETAEKKPYFAKPYLTFSPRQFTLNPGEVQTINVARKSLSKAPDGEFVSHLKISEISLGKPKINDNAKATTLSIDIKALFAVTLPVTIAKGETLLSKTILVSHKRAANNNLELTLRRLGNVSSRVNVAIIDSTTQKEIGRVNGVKIYMSTDDLTFNVPLDKGTETVKSAVLKIEDAKSKEEISKQAISL